MYLLVFTWGLCRSFSIFIRYLTSGWLRNQTRFSLVIIRVEGLTGKTLTGMISIKGAGHSTDVLLSASNYFRSRYSSHPTLYVVIASTVVWTVHSCTEDTSFIELNGLICLDFFASLIVFIYALAVFVAAWVQTEAPHTLWKGPSPVELLQSANLDGSSSRLFYLSDFFIKVCRIPYWHRNLNSASGSRTSLTLPITSHSVIQKGCCLFLFWWNSRINMLLVDVLRTLRCFLTALPTLAPLLLIVVGR